MNEEQEQNKINMRDKVLTEINSGSISMRPKLRFTLQFVSLVALVICILVISIFILNFLSFVNRINHHDDLLSFGARGVWTFILFFPWFLLLVDIALIVLLESLVRKFRFGYRFPVLYLLGGIFTVTILSGFVLDRGTGFNDRLFEQSHNLPGPIKSMYSSAKRNPGPGSGVCLCTIISINDHNFIVDDNRDSDDGTTLTVVLPPGRFENIQKELHVGSTVLIAGDEESGIIQAFGMSPVFQGR